MRLTLEEAVQTLREQLTAETAMFDGTGEDALEVLVDHIDELHRAARAVEENWASGDLAGAVNDLIFLIPEDAELRATFLMPLPEGDD